jgi:hypothetical protein
MRNPRWLPSQVIVLTQDHMGKCRNIFFSEAIAALTISVFPRSHLNTFPMGPMLIYILQWWPSWISDRHRKHKFTGSYGKMQKYFLL